MSLIMNAVKAAEDDDEDASYISLANQTGFTAIDFYSGSLEAAEYAYEQLNGGIFPRIISVVGESATGKTTLSIQMIGSAIERWRRHTGMHDTAEFLFYDIEHNTPISRIKKLLRWSDRDILTTLDYKDDSASVLDIYNRVRRIAFEKERNKSALQYTTTFKDISGKPITIYAPTFILVDSVAVLNMDGVEEFEVDKTGNVKDVESVVRNIDGARDAKAMTGLIKKVKPYLQKFNINLIMINHITEEMSTSMYDLPKRFLPFLKPGEKLKGGKEMIFQSFAIIKTEAREKIDDKKPIFGDDIRGLIARIMFVKNKNNVEGLPFVMVFDQNTGYRPELSDFEMLNEHTYGFSGSPMSYRLDILPEVSFTRKTIIKTCEENELFARALSMTTRLYLFYTVVMKIDPPDSKAFASLSYETREALIWSYGNAYPGYHYTLPFNVKRESILREFDREYDMGNSYMTEAQYDLLVNRGEGEPEFVAGLLTRITPYDELLSDGGDEYYFAKE